MFTSDIRMNKKCDPCDFDRDMDVGTRRAAVNFRNC